MRLPSLTTVVRTLYTLNATLTATTTSSSTRHPLLRVASGPTAWARRGVRSMPSIPFLGALFSSSKPDPMSYPVQKSADEWQAVLSPEQFRVLREKGTEAPFTGAYDKHLPDAGVYACAACAAPLYRAAHKFKSGCGWPAYFDSLPGAVTRHEDRTWGMARTEIVCSNCGGHLGHVFKGEGYPTPTDERHCVNSISLTFHTDDAAGGSGGRDSKA